MGRHARTVALLLKVKALRHEGLTPTAIGETLGIARSSVYRLLGEGEAAA